MVIVIVIVVVSIYLFPIIIFGIVDYLRCPKGTTLGNFLNGTWYLADSDRDFDEGYDGYLNFEPTWIPVINILFVLMAVLVHIGRIIKKSKLLEIKIK